MAGIQGNITLDFFWALDDYWFQQRSRNVPCLSWILQILKGKSSFGIEWKHWDQHPNNVKCIIFWFQGRQRKTYNADNECFALGGNGFQIWEGAPEICSNIQDQKQQKCLVQPIQARLRRLWGLGVSGAALMPLSEPYFEIQYIEGALASSTFWSNFNWKQLSVNDSLYFFLCFQFICSNIDSCTAEI